MELSDFAERILYGTRLDDKLVTPEGVTDFLPRSLHSIPDAPGRPQALALDGDGPTRKVAFPGLHQLDDARVRGHVLHFFANHELLALELMALILLRFPEAPASFRMGIYRTMAEEQRHLAMYRERMEAAGVEFGEIPVNAFFWRVLRDVQSPLEFVAGMSMTFEQANLDFAGYYARAFRRIGDVSTADVLDVVYAEEIGHVKHGVTWFDRWRPRERSRFRAYEVLLPEGLSPIRAKGTEFDAEARRLAGLDDDFIERLRIFRASKGRPPQVLWFNPGAEEEVRHGASWTPPRVLQQMSGDLGSLMGFLAAEEDIVLCEHAPSREHVRSLDDLGLSLPAARELHTAADASALIHERHVGALVPWGVSPRARALFAPIADRVVASAQGEFEAWGKGIRIYSREETQGIRRASFDQLERGRREGGPERLVGGAAAGTLLSHMDAVDAWLGERARPVVFKAVLGASGRGAIRVYDERLSADQRAWLTKHIAQDGAVLAEPWLDRVADFSWQMVVRDDEIQHVGGLRFLTDHRGQFLGTVLHRASEGLSPELVRWMHGDGRQTRWFRASQQQAADLVGRELQARGYRGPVGVDQLVCRENGGYRLHPLVEVNTRLTMGRVSLALERRVARRRVGVMLLLPLRGLLERFGRIASAQEWARTTHPASVLGEGKDRGIDEGIVWLTDPTRARAHVAVLIVGRNWESLCAQATGLCDAAAAALAPALGASGR